MEFERGIWSAAMDGEEERVKRLLASGTNPNATDSAGYTALVSWKNLFLVLVIEFHKSVSVCNAGRWHTDDHHTLFLVHKKNKAIVQVWLMAVVH